MQIWCGRCERKAGVEPAAVFSRIPCAEAVDRLYEAGESRQSFTLYEIVRYF